MQLKKFEFTNLHLQLVLNAVSPFTFEAASKAVTNLQQTVRKMLTVIIKSVILYLMNKEDQIRYDVLKNINSAADIKSIDIIDEFEDDNCLCFEVQFNKIPIDIFFGWYDFGTSEHFRLFFERKESQKIVMECIENCKASLTSA